MDLLRIEHLYKSYWVDGKEVSVLRDINLTFPPCGLVFLLGPSGSGKSTLLQMIAGITAPSEGMLFDDGVLRITSKAQRHYIDRTSLLFQSFLLLEEYHPLMNVMMPMLAKGNPYRVAKKQALVLFKRYNLQHLIKRDTRSLSGGEKQRIALLRLLAHDQPIFLADEPTGALDDENGLFLIEQLQVISSQKLVIVVTHNQALAEKYADRILYLFDGRIDKDEEISKRLKEQKPLSKSQPKESNFLGYAIAMHDIKHHFNRHALGFIASAICVLCLLVGIHFYQTTNAFMNTFTPLVSDYPFVQVNKKKAFQVEGSPLVLTKVERPSLSEIEAVMTYFPHCTYEVDLHPLLNQNVKIIIGDQTYHDFYLSFYDDTNNDGSFLYANSLLWSNIEHGKEEVGILSWIFTIEQSSDLGIEQIPFALPFKLKLAEEETEFMNEPSLYVPYRFICNHLETMTLERGDQTIIGYLRNLPSNHYLTGYGYTIYLSNIALYHKIQALNEAEYQGSTFSFSNSQLMIYTAFQSMFSGLHMIILIFLLISIFGTAALVGILTYTNIQLHRKEMAILTILGMKKKKIWSIFVFENGGLQLFSCISATLLSRLLEPLIQPILEQGFGLPAIFSLNQSHQIDIIIVATTMVFSLLLTGIILFSVGQIELEKELKEL